METQPLVEGNMTELKWRKTLLETPSGFALFAVDEDVLKEPDDIWVYFKNVSTAKHIMFCLGDVQFADKSVAWDGQTQPSKDLIRLIRKSFKSKKDLIVQSAELQAVIKEKLNIQCSYEPTVTDELIWGMKHVLRGFMLYEASKITKEYRLPLSKGLQRFLQDHLINISPKMLHNKFISEIGLLRYVDTTLEQVPKTLRESFDKHVCRIGESIEDDLDYGRVLARILVPELAPQYDFSKMFPLDLALKIEEADKHATKYRYEKLSMHDREIIMGALSHLLVVPKQRIEIMIRVKRMQSEMTYHFRTFEGTHEEPIREPANLKDSTYRRTLLETPSGFAIFYICEDVFEQPQAYPNLLGTKGYVVVVVVVVFEQPQHIWTSFITEMEALGVVLALGFVKVHDKSIVRDSCHGPGQDLSRLIRKLCPHKTKLIVQDDDLKSVIEEKLKVQCCTKFSNDDDGVGDLMWGLKHVLHEFIPQEKGNLTEDYYLPMSKGLQNVLQSYGISVSLGQSLSSDLEGKVAEVATKVNKSGKSIDDHDKEVVLAVCGYLSDVREKKDQCLRFLKRNGSEQEELPTVGVDYDYEVTSWLTSLSKK